MNAFLVFITVAHLLFALTSQELSLVDVEVVLLETLQLSDVPRKPVSTFLISFPLF
jgi:hypothetical protein